MAALLLPFILLISLVVPLSESLVKIHSQLRGLAVLDKKIGDGAEEISRTLNLALTLNTGLIALYALCPAAIVSGTAAALKVKGEIIRVQQEMLLYSAELNLKSFRPWIFYTKLNKPKRNAGGICEIPGTLYCPQKEIFQIKTINNSLPAGVLAESNLCTHVTWRYADSRVRPL